MRIAVLGGGGGLGRNVVDAALAAQHEVVALVRDSRRTALPATVATVVGDAARPEDLMRVMDGTDATTFCVMPRFASWLNEFAPLLEAAIEAARQTGSRLIFPANVWIYGPGQVGDLVNEARAPTPISQRGKLRAEMEQRLRTAGVRYAVVRLPEFYGPNVVTLTARVFRAVLEGRRVLWPGPLDHTIELVYMPDAARILVEVAAAPNGDAAVFHMPGVYTTPRQFARLVSVLSGSSAHISSVPNWLLSAVGIFSPGIRGVSENVHLWKHPILLDGAACKARFGAIPTTLLNEAVQATLAWHLNHRHVRLQS